MKPYALRSEPQLVTSGTPSWMFGLGVPRTFSSVFLKDRFVGGRVQRRSVYRALLRAKGGENLRDVLRIKRDLALTQEGPEVVSH